MDNSLNSDLFGDDCDDADDQGAGSIPNKVQTFYDSVLATTKESLHAYKIEIQKTTFPTYFSTVLEDSWSCITCGLEDLIKGLLSESTVPIDKIVGYLQDSVFLLGMLSQLNKSMIESVSMKCSAMKTLPKQTGLIMLSVFEHCKDSETIYGYYLKSVEQQLKDLFRVCHELQLTYLLILEKHFIFDFDEMEEKSILIEAFQINLSIGKVVHSLDVKTMADQWKAYTALCEKYISCISGTDIFVDCSQVLCDLVKENIETAVEPNQDKTVIMRSLKVASFTIKILVKICNIFRLSCNKNYSCIVALLKYIKIKYAGLESSANKLTTEMNSNLVMPSDSLMKELLCDEEFFACLVNLSLNCEQMRNEDNVLGLILIVTTAMKCAAQGKKPGLKTKLVSCIYNLLPYSDFCLRSINENHSQLEHTVTHTAALALTMTNEEFNALEKNMVEAMLSTDCISALFSSKLWIILANYISTQLLFNQLIWLCNMYKKLDNLKYFYRTPQNIHLSYTLSRLFKVLDDEDKLKFCKQFRIHDEDNVTLWTALRIRNLPTESQTHAEDVIADKLRTIYGKLAEADSPDLLIRMINLAATCTFKNTRGIDDQLERAWSRACPEGNTIVQGLDNNTAWFYEYLQALVALTDTLMSRLKDRNVNIVKILHVVSGVIKTGDPEMKLVLTKILCKLATCQANEHKNLIDSHLNAALTCLLQSPDDIVRLNLIRTSRSYKNSYLDSLITNIVKENSLQGTLQSLNRGTDFQSDCKYTHKCFESKVDVVSVQELKEANLEDFYFDSGGSEMLTEIEEPCSKKGKPNTHEVDSIIRNLENNVSLLVSQTFYTPEQVMKVQTVCQKLKNISH